MAVPLVFAPIVLQTHPDRCLTPLPTWALPEAKAQVDQAGQAGQGVVRATAQAVRNYRDVERMPCVKRVGSGITDINGLSSIDMALAAADTAVDSATRRGADAFARMVDDWRASIIRFRCALSPEQLRQHLPNELPTGAPWRCDDLRFEVGVIGFDKLAGARADRLKNMPTRLVLPKVDIDEAIAAATRRATARPCAAT